MSPTTMIDKKTLYEVFIDYMQPQYVTYKGSKPYRDLVDAFYDYVTTKGDSRDEKRQILYHAKEVFEDYAAFEEKQVNGPSIKESGWGSISERPQKPYNFAYRDSNDGE